MRQVPLSAEPLIRPHLLATHSSRISADSGLGAQLPQTCHAVSAGRHEHRALVHDRCWKAGIAEHPADSDARPTGLANALLSKDADKSSGSEVDADVAPDEEA